MLLKLIYSINMIVIDITILPAL